MVDQVKTLANQSMLFSVNIKMKSFRKLDKGESRKVTASNGATEDAARVNKFLLAGTTQLREFELWVASHRNEIKRRSRGYGDNGDRIIHIAKFIDTRDWINDCKREFYQRRDNFLTIYPNLVSAQAFQLGNMFDRSEYPDVAQLANDFQYNVSWSVLDPRGDWINNLTLEVAEEVRAECEATANRRVTDLLEGLWKDVYDVVKHISERLADADEEGGKKSRLHDTVITNAVEMCEILRTMNITNDSGLEWARQQLEQSLHGVTMDDIRASDGLRRKVKAQVDDLADRLGW